MGITWIGAALAAAGLGWWLFTEWLRHRPHNLRRGTQDLVWLGMPGCWVFVAGVVTIVAGLVRLLLP
jgi:hypothetical protein